MSETIETRLIRWLLDRDTGSSSKAIASVLSGNGGKNAGHSYPSDGDDLGRCLRLLEVIPEWKPRLKEMATLSPQWAALIRNWDELTVLHAAGDKNIYERMQSILRPIEDKDSSIVRLGPNASIRFGR